jgi:UDP-N-acetylmuramoyl-tripeptide--D-alanyl-D-alanine ligase
LKAKFIGITGSNGKTTTKEFTYNLIKSVEKETYCSPGNFNNLFGVPLAMFNIPENSKVAVMELGISTKDEMPKLAEVVKPDVILFTNVGPSHLEFLSTVTDVARAKLTLLEKAPKNVPAIINADDSVLMMEALKLRDDLITFGLNKKADFTIDSLEQDNHGNSLITIENHKFKMPLFGKHHAYNLLAAYAVFKTMGYDFGNINTESIKFDSAPMRGQIEIKDGIKFIVDCYNANPDSVKSGLESFHDFKTDQRKVVIIGDMLELGTDSIKYHKEIGSIVSKYDFDLLVTVGEHSKYIKDEANTINSISYNTSDDAFEDIKNILKENDLVYVKGSRGVALEKILTAYEIGEEI